MEAQVDARHGLIAPVLLVNITPPALLQPTALALPVVLMNIPTVALPRNVRPRPVQPLVMLDKAFWMVVHQPTVHVARAWQEHFRPTTAVRPRVVPVLLASSPQTARMPVRLGRPVQRAKATQPEALQPTPHVRHAKQEHFRATMEVPPHVVPVQQTHSPLKARMLVRLGRPAMLENFARLEPQRPTLPVRLAPLPSTNQTRPVRPQAAFPVPTPVSTAQEVRRLARAHCPLVTRVIALWTA